MRATAAAAAARNGLHVVLHHRSISLAALSYRALALAPLPSFVKETRISAIAAFRCMFAFLRPASVPSLSSLGRALARSLGGGGGGGEENICAIVKPTG